MVFSACQKLEDLNKNTKDFTAVPGEGIYNGAIRNLLNQLHTFNVNNNNDVHLYDDKKNDDNSHSCATKLQIIFKIS